MTSHAPGAVISAAGGALLWATIGPAAALLDTHDRLAAAAVRLAIGTLVLFAVVGGRPLTTRWRRSELRSLAVGAVGIAGFQMTYFGAIGHSGVAISTTLAIGLSPVMTGMWTWLRTRERPAIGWMVGTAIAATGLVLLMYGRGVTGPASPTGIILSLLAAMFFSMHAIAIQLTTSGQTPATTLTAMFGLAALLLIPVTVAIGPQGLLSGPVVTCVVYLGVVTTGIAYWLFARGVRHLGAATAVTISLLEPAGAAIIAAVAFREHVSLAQWTGIGLICAAIASIGFAGPKLKPT
ncbi:DMT family transporter [Actinocrispum wychmicini]|uniref:DME family drug/metabolite transporter n=1 Tax=Actinocrispum wychmicini TaxID=1213861 RepID=A0A4R2IPP2_9PSEU|nr:EamA family transporter [Actinocrispum wychmicini]TCO47271.1 DME family drug/metabolite transporter [Actinocrispum wychmicini]